MRLLLIVAMLASVGAPVSGQIVAIKTVPLAAGNQFDVFPAANRGMGGSFLALDDVLLDPFLNPAKGARLEGAQFVGTPGYYGISNDHGSARTLPIAGLFGSESWFGSFSLALQQLDAGGNGAFGAFPTRLSERSAGNVYLSGSTGLSLGSGGWALAGGASYAALGAVDGVDLLYQGAESIVQNGHLLDVRLGVLRDGEQAFEAVAVHRRFRMTHDVTYPFWARPAIDVPVPQAVEERNFDRTNTWGMRLGYRAPLASDGWRIGGTLTGNYKSHPKIPNYRIQNLPRDPGDSWAYAMGIGVARVEDRGRLGLDLVFEPIWSNTWAEAEVPLRAWDGRIIQRGGKTVENDFFFTNVTVRLGLERSVGTTDLQFGLDVQSIRYTLDQFDNVVGTRRDQTENWMEWQPSWGIRFAVGDLQFHYSGTLTTGTGRPGVDDDVVFDLEAAARVDVVLAPSGPLTLQNARIHSHRLSISVPLGDR